MNDEERFQDLMDAIECVIHQYEEIEARLARIERKIDMIFEDDYDEGMSNETIPMMP